MRFSNLPVIDWFETGRSSGAVQVGPGTGVSGSTKEIFGGSAGGSVLGGVPDGHGIGVADGYGWGVPTSGPRVLSGSDGVDARDVVVPVGPVAV